MRANSWNVLVVVAIGFAMLVSGCDDVGPSTGSNASHPPGSAPPPPPPGATRLDGPIPPPIPATPNLNSDLSTGRDGGGVDETNQDDEFGNIMDGATAGDTEGVEREVAGVGVGVKGRKYGGGIISEPIRQYFRAQQQIAFIQLAQAMQLFKAEKDRVPSSHEEFMKSIIEANQIALPELPAGEQYRYDPKLGELMVERPQ